MVCSFHLDFWQIFGRTQFPYLPPFFFDNATSATSAAPHLSLHLRLAI
jgi:hypothetical protein